MVKFNALSFTFTIEEAVEAAPQTFASLFPGRCWMDALELALSCSSLYKLTAKTGREADISMSSESSHILHLLQSTTLGDMEPLQ